MVAIWSQYGGNILPSVRKGLGSRNKGLDGLVGIKRGAGLTQAHSKISDGQSTIMGNCGCRNSPVGGGVLRGIKKPRQTSGLLCPGLDSNQHTSRRRHLKTVRLPISPPGLLTFFGNGMQIYSIPKYKTQKNYAPEFFLFGASNKIPAITNPVPASWAIKMGSPRM